MLKIGKTAYAAVDDYGEIVCTAESPLISDDRSSLYEEMKAWHINRNEYKVKEIKIVLVEEK